MKFQVPRGTKDILPKDVYLWQQVELEARKTFAVYGFSEIRTPIFENEALFRRSLGATTDIVQKQMFSFKQGDDCFVLRPEATASIARAYLEHNLGFGAKLTKLYYIGSMFRAERPQRGRLREFHHIGVEAIGYANPNIDVDLIELADRLLRILLIERYEFVINSLGCDKDKDRYQALLKSSLSSHKKSLCKDCQIRLSKNVFRVLDCKQEACKKIVKSLQCGHEEYLCPDCRSYFNEVVSGLNDYGIKFKVQTRLVRGLDYYSGVVFEIVHPDLGAQDALGAGGRYDSLFQELGGKKIGAAGFALGQERLMLVMPKKSSPPLQTYLVSLGTNVNKKALEFVRKIRAAEIGCDYDLIDRSLKSKLKSADKLGVKFAIIIGDSELEKGNAIVRDLRNSTQTDVKFEELIEYLKQQVDT